MKSIREYFTINGMRREPLVGKYTFLHYLRILQFNINLAANLRENLFSILQHLLLPYFSHCNGSKTRYIVHTHNDNNNNNNCWQQSSSTKIITVRNGWWVNIAVNGKYNSIFVIDLIQFEWNVEMNSNFKFG